MQTCVRIWFERYASGEKKLTGEGDEQDGCAVEGHRVAVKGDPDLAAGILAEAGAEADEGRVRPDEDAVLQGEGRANGAHRGVGPEGLVGDSRVRGDELAAARQLAVGEVEGRRERAGSRVDGAGGADEAVGARELALGEVVAAVEGCGHVDALDGKDVGLAGWGSGGDAARRAAGARGGARCGSIGAGG